MFRGLRVEHVANGFSNAAMHLGSNQRVEDCRVEYNNVNGIKAYSGFVFMRSTSNHNGSLGIGLNGSNSLLESSETSYNSWRYGPTWQAGGIKILGGMPSNNRIVRPYSQLQQRERNMVRHRRFGQRRRGIALRRQCLYCS